MCNNIEHKQTRIIESGKSQICELLEALGPVYMEPSFLS